MSKNKLFLYKATLCLFVLFCSIPIHAQTDVIIHYTDNTEKTFSVTENGKIYFSDDNLIIEEDFGNPVTIAISVIRKLVFESQTSSSSSIFQDQPDINRVFIYPNPTQNYLQIANLETGKANIRIFSVSGSLMWQDTITSDSNIDVSQFPAGLYLIQINETTLKFTKR